MAISLLTYGVKELAEGVHVDFNDSPTSIAIGSFDCTMKDNTLNAIPRTTFATVDEARAMIEPHLRDLLNLSDPLEQATAAFLRLKTLLT